MELQEAIMKRRSVRKFTDYKVTDEELKEMLEAARFAPSWANSQAWEFIVVRDKNIIEKIVETYPETNPSRKCSLAASALIIGCAKNDLSGFKKGEKSTKFGEWFMFDLGLAVQNLSLKAHEIGLGSVILGLFDHEACREVLSVPQGYEVVVIIPIGKPATAGKDAPPRKELDKFVYLNKFGNTFV